MNDVIRTSNENPLLKPMRDLYRAYVRLLESGKERIEFHGGTCDSVEQMERGDPYLIAANVAMQAAQIEQRHSHETSDALDAAKWRALRNCARITAMGSAGCIQPHPDDYAHVTLNFWSVHPGGPGEPYAREWLDSFVSAALRAQTAPAQKASDDLIRRPTGQCSWGCYYSDNGRLVRDSACTVHGASSQSEGASGE